mgnify:CR=1 FL=1
MSKELVVRQDSELGRLLEALVVLADHDVEAGRAALIKKAGETALAMWIDQAKKDKELDQEHKALVPASEDWAS